MEGGNRIDIGNGFGCAELFWYWLWLSYFIIVYFIIVVGNDSLFYYYWLWE